MVDNINLLLSGAKQTACAPLREIANNVNPLHEFQNRHRRRIRSELRQFLHCDHPFAID